MDKLIVVKTERGWEIGTLDALSVVNLEGDSVAFKTKAEALAELRCQQRQRAACRAAERNDAAKYDHACGYQD